MNHVSRPSPQTSNFLPSKPASLGWRLFVPSSVTNYCDGTILHVRYLLHTCVVMGPCQEYEVEPKSLCTPLWVSRLVARSKPMRTGYELLLRSI